MYIYIYRYTYMHIYHIGTLGHSEVKRVVGPIFPVQRFQSQSELFRSPRKLRRRQRPLSFKENSINRGMFHDNTTSGND